MVDHPYVIVPSGNISAQEVGKEQALDNNLDSDIVYFAQKRHTAKAYDPDKKISKDDLKKIKTLLCLAASSTNSQPWHFFVAQTDEGKARIAKSTETRFAQNTQAILDASVAIVFCHKTDIDETYLSRLLEQEEQDGRFAPAPEFKDIVHTNRRRYVNIHKNELNDLPDWTARQVYLNLGSFLLGVAALGLDATPMEGVDKEILNEEFNLKQKGYASLVVVTIGHSHPDKDFNAKLPKSRLPLSDIITEI